MTTDEARNLLLGDDTPAATVVVAQPTRGRPTGTISAPSVELLASKLQGRTSHVEALETAAGTWESCRAEEISQERAIGVSPRTPPPSPPTRTARTWCRRAGCKAPSAGSELARRCADLYPAPPTSILRAEGIPEAYPPQSDDEQEKLALVCVQEAPAPWPTRGKVIQEPLPCNALPTGKGKKGATAAIERK